MTRRQDTIPAAYFDDLYTAKDDPWGFRTSAYEQAKYADTIVQLGSGRFATGLEVGCALGVLTRLLAARCDRLVAIDASAVALGAARAACADCPNVRFALAAVPGDFPAGRYDLIVLSEVVYYLVPADVERLAALCHDHAADDAEILLCHWLGETDYPLSGDEAADLFVASMVPRGWSHQTWRRDQYRLDRLRRETR